MPLTPFAMSKIIMNIIKFIYLCFCMPISNLSITFTFSDTGVNSLLKLIIRRSVKDQSFTNPVLQYDIRMLGRKAIIDTVLAPRRPTTLRPVLNVLFALVPAFK